MMRYILLALVGVLSSCGGSPEDTPAHAPTALVATSRAGMTPIEETTVLYGIVEMNSGAERLLLAPIDAVLRSIDAPVGTRVQRGQVVARLAPGPATRVDTAKANADARVADAAAARASRLRADGLVGDAEVEAARAAAQGADAVRDRLSGRESLILRAPVDGNVASVAVRAGELVPAGSAVASIVRSNDVHARFGIDPALAPRVSAGTNLVFTAPGGASMHSQVLSVSPLADADSKLISVFARIEPSSDLLPGVALKATLTLEGTRTALTIPYAALLDDGGQPFVFVVIGGIAHRHDVVTGTAASNRVAVITGLEHGDEVISEGGTEVEDGMKVRLK